jgi:thiol-disulfide isomerase/thioredoxin
VAPEKAPDRRKTAPEAKAGWVLIAFALVLVGVLVLPNVLGFARRAQHALIGEAAPDLDLLVAKNGVAGVAEGSTLRLAQLRGQPVLLDFWASWCGPCAMQAPILERLSQRYGKDGLVVVGVNVDDAPEVARHYAEKRELSYPIVVDVRDEAQKLYGVRSLPSVVLVDRKGKVRQFWAGVVDESVLDEEIGQVIGAAP